MQKFNFKKSLGQNFIFDTNLLQAIVKDACVEKKDVLEIGAGGGTLTAQLCKVANKVVSYEIDTNLKDHLTQFLHENKNLTLIFKDALKEDINNIEKHFDGEYILVANLPYYITTPLIFKFIEDGVKITKLVIMVQDEVAKRLTANSGSKEYGAITMAINAIGNVKYARKVGRNNFTPVPNVDSAVVIINLDRNKFNIKNPPILSKVIKALFAMRRKTILNNLTHFFNVNANIASSWLTKANISPTVRGEVLDASQAVNLANIIFDETNKTL